MDEALKKRIKALLARRDDLRTILRENRVVDDILTGRSAVLGIAPDKTTSIIRTGPSVEIDTVKGLGGMPPQQMATTTQPTGKESRYLFKSNREHPEEYAKRLAMTPFTVQLLDILQSRNGTLAKASVTVDAADPVKELLQSLTLRGMTFDDVRAKLAEMVQTGGFAGVLLDRASLPDDVQARKAAGEAISQAEADQRKLGRPIWALYPAAQILDYREDDRGLLWVKLVEQSCEKTDPLSPEVYVYTVRIVNRKQIQVWRIESESFFDLEADPPDKTKLIDKGAVDNPPEAIDEDGQPCVPFRMSHPFPARDGVGRSVLLNVAELDISALRILSAIIWCLYVAGDPTLVFWSNRTGDEIPDIGLGTSHYVILQQALANVRDKEELSFLQLDVAGIEQQKAMFESIQGQARSAAGKMPSSATQGPREQTGISKAWTFKTGEERLIFLIAENLQSTFDWLLRLTSRYMKADPEKVKVAYPHAYDVEGPVEVTELVEQVLPIAKALDQREAVKQLIKKLFTALDLNWNDELEADLDKIADMALQPEQMLAGGPDDPNAQAVGKDVQKQTLKGAKGESDDNTTGAALPLRPM